MEQFVDIHTHHHPSPETLSLSNYRLGVDIAMPCAPFSAGIHPWDADKIADCEGLLDELEKIDCMAIGEIGLDFACSVDRTLQQTLFERQLAIASRRNLPVIIHNVKATAEVLATLALYPIPAVIFHGFIGSKEQLGQIVARGFYVSFGFGALRSPRTIEALVACPATALLLESDTAGEPILALYTEVAKLRQTTTQQLATEIYSNYTKIFNK